MKPGYRLHGPFLKNLERYNLEFEAFRSKRGALKSLLNAFRSGCNAFRWQLNALTSELNAFHLERNASNSTGGLTPPRDSFIAPEAGSAEL
jgi:hypothetical protein